MVSPASVREIQVDSLIKKLCVVIPVVTLATEFNCGYNSYRIYYIKRLNIIFMCTEANANSLCLGEIYRNIHTHEAVLKNNTSYFLIFSKHK